MTCSRRLSVLVALTIATAACGPVANSAATGSIVPATAVPSLAPSSPSPASTAAPPSSAPTTDPAFVLAAAGIGPYLVGASLGELQSRALVANVDKSFHCDESWQLAQATDPYGGRLALTFHLGRMTDVSTDSTDLVTPEGARVGMSVAELERIYAGQATRVMGVSGNQAVAVRTPDTALGFVFYLDESNTTARSIGAGEVQRLEEIAVVGEGC